MKNKDKLVLLIIPCLCLLWIFIILPQGEIFGSQTDWFSQHIQIGESLRSLIYEKHTLIPDYLPFLGGGQNAYAFSYYGLFRMDILISLALPFIAMKDIIIAYMVISLIASIDLCYLWLRKHDFKISVSLFFALTLFLSSLLFQAHRQIMFVNYMPFLLFALISIDYYLKKKKTTYLIISILLTITHSYFFSISAIFILFLYLLYQAKNLGIPLLSIKHKKIIFGFIKTCIIAILIAAILLLPTALVMLEHSKSVAITTWSDIFTFDLSLKSLLYDPYGCGLTMISWILLCLGIMFKKTRKLSIFFLCAITLPIISYLLNGTLYVRYKVLLPFLPIMIYLMSDILREWCKKEYNIPPWILFLLLIPVLTVHKSDWILLDFIISILLLFLYHSYKKGILLVIALCVPLTSSYIVNQKENYVSEKQYQQVTSYQDTLTIPSNHSRSDDLRAPLSTSNQYLPNVNKTTMYTSITNTKYNTFFYDIMNNAIPIKNRVACLSQSNPFFQGLMGVRYLLTNQDHIPIGYNQINQKGKQVLLENKDVLPIAYTTSDLYSEKNFDQLAYPFHLDTIYNNAIVKDSDASNYQSKMQKETFNFEVLEKSEFLTIQKQEKKIYIQSKKNSTLKLKLNKNMKDKILLVQFNISQISNHKDHNTTISINEIKNRLSMGKAAYPNKNTTFTYILSNQKEWDELNMKFSKGNYTLSNISFYSLPYSSLTSRNVAALKEKEVKGNEVLKGTLQVSKENSYFITSLPYQKGYRAYVDGKEVEIEIVNKAFVGFKIDPGKHEVTIEFIAPGKEIALIISLLGCLIFIINLLYEQRREKI